MHKKRIAALTLAAIIFNFSSNTVGVLAHEVEQIKPKQGISSKKDVQSNQAKVSKFDLLNNKNLEKYNKVFKLDKSKIIAINNNGGNYPASELYKAIDNNILSPEFSQNEIDDAISIIDEERKRILSHQN